MITFFLRFLILIFFFSSCNLGTSKETNNCGLDSFIEQSLSNNEKRTKAHETTILDNKFIEYLNKSKYNEALKSFSKQFVLDTLKYNAYYAIFPKNDSATNIRSTYSAYRINEYIDDIDKNSLARILTNSSSNLKSDETCFKNIVQLELDYLGCYLITDKKNTQNAVSYFKKYLSQYPESRRVKYLWANLLADLTKTDTCISFYKELIKDFYYEIPCYKRIINYYWRIAPDSALFYSRELSIKFPEACNFLKIILTDLAVDTSVILKECQKCYRGQSSKDSIKARVFFVRKLINSKMTNEAKKNIDKYFKLNKDFVLDDLKLWEHGEYNDILLRYYFIKKDYKSLKLFLNTKVSSVEGPKIENELDLYKLIQKYYFEYINVSTSTKEFDSFFEKNFAGKRLQTSPTGSRM